MHTSALSFPLFDDPSLETDLAQLATRSQRLRQATFAAGCACLAGLALMGVWQMLGASATPMTTFDNLDVPASVLDSLSTTVTRSVSTPFEPLMQTLNAWLNGTLAKILAIGMLMIGLASAVVKNSIIHAVTATAGALLFSYGPQIVLGIAGADQSQTQTQKTLVQRLLSDQDWRQALKEIGPQDGATDTYLTSQVDFLVYQAKRQGQSATEKAKSRAEYVQTAAVHDLARQAFDKLKWKPEAGRLHAMELAAFGTPRSAIAKRYVEEVTATKQSRLSTASRFGALSTVCLGIAAALAALHLTLHRRLGRIRSMGYPGAGLHRADKTAPIESGAAPADTLPSSSPLPLPDPTSGLTPETPDLLAQLALRRAKHERVLSSS